MLQDSKSGSSSIASPDVIAQEIVDDLTDALAEFTIVAEALKAARRTANPGDEGNDAA